MAQVDTSGPALKLIPTTSTSARPPAQHEGWGANELRLCLAPDRSHLQHLYRLEDHRFITNSALFAT